MGVAWEEERRGGGGIEQFIHYQFNWQYQNKHFIDIKHKWALFVTRVIFPTVLWLWLTECGSRGMREGDLGSGVWLHSVHALDWNWPPYSSLGTGENNLNQQNWLLNLLIWLLREKCSYDHMRSMSRPVRSPVSMVWSVGGLVLLLAFCLCHLLCPVLTSTHWHWPVSNVHGPETDRKSNLKTLT